MLFFLERLPNTYGNSIDPNKRYPKNPSYFTLSTIHCIEKTYHSDEKTNCKKCFTHKIILNIFSLLYSIGEERDKCKRLPIFIDELLEF